MPQRRYRSIHAIPPGIIREARTLRRLGIMLSWIAHVLGIPSTALRYRVNEDYPRHYTKGSPPQK